MKTISEIRRQRLQILLSEDGLTYAEMNARLGRNRRDATLSQVAKAAPNTSTGTPRAMGDAQARRLETVFGKPHGWFDLDPDIERSQPAAAAAILHTSSANLPLVPWPFTVSFARYLHLDPLGHARVDEYISLLVEKAERTATHRDADSNRAA
jgi:hypothetical protein